MSIQDALEQATAWLSLNGVEGVGLGEVDGEPCILVLVSSPQQLPPRIPWRFQGYRVEIQSAGRFRAE